MDILKWWPGALLMKGVAAITGDASLDKKVQSSAGWKQRKSLSNHIVQSEKKLVKQVQDINYEAQRHHIREIAYDKEKDLQKQIKKLQSYANTLGEKKLKEIIDDIQSSSDAFIKKIEPTVLAAKNKVTSTIKKATTKKTPSKKKSSSKKPTPKEVIKKK